MVVHTLCGIAITEHNTKLYFRPHESIEYTKRTKQTTNRKTVA